MNITSVKRIHQSDWTDSGVRFLRARDIVAASKNEEPDDYLYISEEKYEEYSALSGKVDIDDLLVTGVGTIGVPYLVENLEPLYFKDGNIIWFQNKNKIDGKFLYYSFIGNGIQSFIKASAGTGTVGTYTIDTGKKTPIQFPSKEEQKKIGEYLTNLDHLITLHQRKCDDTKELKKYMLQKMFPKNGEKFPEIRFKGFTEAWEQRKVFDLLELLTDYDANGSFADMAKNVNTTDGDGYAWYVRITDLENPKPLKELKYVDESSYKFLKKTELHGGELLMAKRGDIGKVYIFEPRTKYATVAPNMYLLKLNNKVIPHFLYDYFVSNEGNKKLTRLNASSTMGALYKDDVKNIDVIMPSTEEQTMIGNFFQSIDNLITLHQRKCDTLKELKKYMLQNMFPKKG